MSTLRREKGQSRLDFVSAPLGRSHTRHTAGAAARRLCRVRPQSRCAPQKQLSGCGSPPVRINNMRANETESIYGDAGANNFFFFYRHVWRISFLKIQFIFTF